MSLNVKVISYKGSTSDYGLETSFSQQGGTIGRSSEKRKNHLSLNDPEKFISRKHAAISFENGSYYLTDTSKDGTYIINKNLHLCRDTVVLNDGDKLKIGDYELIIHVLSSVIPFKFESPTKTAASIEEILPFKEAVITQPESSPFNETSMTERLSNPMEASPLQDPFSLPDLADAPNVPDKIPQQFNFSELLGGTDTGDSPPVPEHPAGDRIAIGSATANGDAFEVPPGKNKLDSSNDQIASSAPLLHGSKQPVEKPLSVESEASRYIRHQAHLELCSAFMEGAGLKNSSFLRNESSTEFMTRVGDLVREMIGGLMVILQGRSELKSALHLSATSITPAGNNPFKSFKIADEIVDQLLTQSKPGFLDAREAIQDAFADIKNHQMAMTAGLQAAIIKLIESFDPQHFVRQNEGGVVFHRKAKSWDAYEKFYAQIATDALEDLFGESFSRGYEKQMRRLRKKKG
jgi:type VI secretion system protein